MDVIFLFLSVVFLFLISFGGTIVGKLFVDYRLMKKEYNDDNHLKV